MKNVKVMGVIIGLLAGLTWGLDTSVLGIVWEHGSVAEIAKNVMIFSIVSTFIHDIISAAWLWIAFAVRGKLIPTLKKVATRSGRFVILGALLGGPIGMSGYVLAINNLGASYTSAISAVFPAVGAFFAYIVLKDKLSLLNWFGLLLSIAGVILIGGIVTGEVENGLLGVFFALICVLGWSLEATVCAYGMKDDDIDPVACVLLRQTTSGLTFGIVLVPIFSNYSTVIEVAQTTTIWYLVAAGLLAAVSYSCYYKAIYMIGPIRGMSTNITYVAWTVFISIVFLGGEFSLTSMIFALIIIAGSIISVLKMQDNPGVVKKNEPEIEAAANETADQMDVDSNIPS